MNRPDTDLRSRPPQRSGAARGSGLCALVAAMLAMGCGKGTDGAATTPTEAAQPNAAAAAAPPAATAAAPAAATAAAPAAATAAAPAAASTAAPSSAVARNPASRPPSAVGALQRGPRGQPLLFRLRDTLKALGMDVRGIQQNEQAIEVTLEATAHDRNDDELLMSWAKAFGVLAHAGSPTVVLHIELGGRPTMVLSAEAAEIQAVANGKRSVRDFMASLRLQAAGQGAAAQPAVAPAAAPVVAPPAAPTAAAPVAAPAAAPAAAAAPVAAPVAAPPAAPAPKTVAPHVRASGGPSRPSGRVSRPSGASTGPSRPGRPSRPSR